MDDKQRQHILQNLDKLVRLTNYDELIAHCIDNALITYIMRQHIENITDNLRDEELQVERHRRLFVKLTKRGPTAYRRLKSILSDMKCDAAVLLLNEPMHQESQFTPLNPGMYLSRDNRLKSQLLIDDHHGNRSHGHNNANSSLHTQIHQLPLEDFTNQQQPQQNLQQQHKQQQRRISDTVDETLLKTSPIVERDSNGLPLLQPYDEEILPLDYKVKKSTEIHIDDKVGWYPMRSQHHRGVFFCVNIIDFPNKARRRNGAEEDRKSLLYLFQELGFKLFYYENLRQCEFEHLLDLILHSEYTRETESFVMVLMTHGESTDQFTEIVEFADGAVMKVREIEKRFGNGECAHLLHKPKILVFPFCRGKIKDFGQRQQQQQHQQQQQQQQQQQLKQQIQLQLKISQHQQQSSLYHIQTDHIGGDDLPKPTPVPTYSDMMISFASLRGYAAHRDPLEGSWYIQTFCQLMAENAHDTSFNNILMMIQTKMLDHSDNGAIQMPSYYNIGFSKMLYLNPGYWLDDHHP